MEIEEHIRFWLDSADHDLATAEALFDAGKYDWCLFLGHLVLEKCLKALYVEKHDRIPTRTHNLVKLAERTSLSVSDDLREFLDEVTDFNLEVRYPEYKREFYKRCTREFCDEKIMKIKDCYIWLKSQLKSNQS